MIVRGFLYTICVAFFLKDLRCFLGEGVTAGGVTVRLFAFRGDVRCLDGVEVIAADDESTVAAVAEDVMARARRACWGANSAICSTAKLSWAAAFSAAAASEEIMSSIAMCDTPGIFVLARVALGVALVVVVASLAVEDIGA